jgi:hypothetical protein
MWQLVQKFTKPSSSTPWYHESSAQAATENAWLDNWARNHIREDLGDSINFEYHDTTAQLTITIQDLARAQQFVEAVSNDQTLLEYSTRLYTWGHAAGVEQLTNDPEFPDAGFTDIYDQLIGA